MMKVILVAFLLVLSIVDSTYYYDAVVPVSFVYPTRIAGDAFYYDAPEAHSRGKLTNLLSRVCQKKNARPTCAPAPPPTSNFTSCIDQNGGVSMSPSGMIALTSPFKGFCFFGFGTLVPNTKITMTCTNVAGGLSMSPNPTSVPSGSPLTTFKAGTYTVNGPSIIMLFLGDGSSLIDCTWTASP